MTTARPSFPIFNDGKTFANGAWRRDVFLHVHDHSFHAIK